MLNKLSGDAFLTEVQKARNDLWLSKIKKYLSEQQFLELTIGSDVYISGHVAQFIVNNWNKGD